VMNANNLNAAAFPPPQKKTAHPISRPVESIDSRAKDSWIGLGVKSEPKRLTEAFQDQPQPDHS